jgi:hypothetical protein
MRNHRKSSNAIHRKIAALLFTKVSHTKVNYDQISLSTPNVSINKMLTEKKILLKTSLINISNNIWKRKNLIVILQKEFLFISKRYDLIRTFMSVINKSTSIRIKLTCSYAVYFLLYHHTQMPSYNVH